MSTSPRLLQLSRAAVPGRTDSATLDDVITKWGWSTWSMPFYVESAGYWTGLAIANPGDSPAQITITAYERGGNQLASANVTLEARQSRTQLVYQWLAGLPAGTTGQIVVTSSTPVQLVAHFGADDNASLAAIPL